MEDLIEEYLTHGGITGAEIPSDVKYIPAKLGPVLGVVFDAARHKSQKHPDPFEKVLVAYTIKANDGKEAYLEVKKGKLYALVSKGLNVEIWGKLLVIGARTDHEIRRAKKTRSGTVKR